MTGLTTEQVDALLQPLDKGRVKQKQGQSHLEAWDDRRHLLRVFGWGGFDIETLECSCILERSVWSSEKANETHLGRHTVVYRVQARLVIKDVEGRPLCHFDDGAVGASQNQPSFSDAHDQAMKTAFSQALKRCCVNLGDRFGLSLYNKGTTGAVVGKSLAHTATLEHAAVEEVTGGELDEPDPAPEVEVDGQNETIETLDKKGLVQKLSDLRLSTAGNEETLRQRLADATAPFVDNSTDDLSLPISDPVKRAERAAQIAEENGLTERAEALRAKVAAGKADDVKAKAAGGDA